MREIHFYEGVGAPEGVLSSWRTTKAAIEAKKPIIHTTQMALLSTSLFESGYRIFIHPEPKSPLAAYELTLGCGNIATNREITMEHNLYRLWETGKLRGPTNPHRFPTQDRLSALRAEYPNGTRIRLTRELEDPFVLLKSGEKATVQSVDDLGQLHVLWDRGVSLAVDPDVDAFEKIGLEIEWTGENGVKFKPFSIGSLSVTLDIGPISDRLWGIYAAICSECSNQKSTRCKIDSVTGVLKDAIYQANRLLGQ